MPAQTPDVSGRRLTVATPMYEGMCHAAYTRGLVELALACRERGVALSLNLITNQPCISRARAYAANAFVNSGGQHLMMIDADMGFSASDVLALLAVQVENPDYAVIGAAASRKMIDWQRVERAAKSGAAVPLAKVAGSMAVNFGAGTTRMRVDRPHPVEHLGAAFMMIARSAFETLDARHPELAWATADWERDNFALGARATAYFETAIDAASESYLSEDFAFCRRVRDAGMAVWLAPWIELTHVGNMNFQSSFRELARLEAHINQ